MTRHVADKRSPSDGGRLKQFLRIDRQDGEGLWRRIAKAIPAPSSGRRVAEFARIDRGRRA